MKRANTPAILFHNMQHMSPHCEDSAHHTQGLILNFGNYFGYVGTYLESRRNIVSTFLFSMVSSLKTRSKSIFTEENGQISAILSFL